MTFGAPAGFHDLLAGERFSLATYPVDFSARAMHADPVHQRLMRHPFLNQARLGRYWVRASLGADAGAAGDAWPRPSRGPTPWSRTPPSPA